MPKFEPNEQTRNQLKELLASDLWKPFQEMLDELKEYALRGCESMAEDQRYYQGMIAAYRAIERNLKAIINPPVGPELSETPTEHYAAKFGRHAVGGY